MGIETEIDEGNEVIDWDVEDTDPHNEFVKFTESEIQQFEEFSKQPNVYQKLVDVFAPSIYENDDVKKGVLL